MLRVNDVCYPAGMRTRLAALAAIFLSACDPVIPRDEVPARVVAEFDPTSSEPKAPRPNDLAVDPATGLLVLEDRSDDTAAERELNRYLRTLDGFPTAATATQSFSAPLDPASVTEAALRVMDVTDPANVTEVSGASIAYDRQRHVVNVGAPWKRERTYVVALLAGESGLRGANGEEVVGSPAFYLLRARRPLVTCADLTSPDCRSSTPLISGDSPEDERTKAVTLERARLKLQPALTWLEGKGVARESVVSAWAFSTVKMGLATFDPANKVIPFPNDLLMKDGRVNLPIEPTDDLAAQELKNALNGLDGFSLTASLVTESGADVGAADVRIDASSLSPSQFRLINLDQPSEEVPVVVTCRSCGDGTRAPSAEPDQIALRPARPLRSHTRYALLWLEGAKTLSGRPVNATPVFALARMRSSLFENGKSTLDSLDDVTAALLEPLRQRLQVAMEAADQKGIAREDVLLAFSFVTQTVTDLAKLRALPSQWNLPTGLEGGMTDVDIAPLQQLTQILQSPFGGNCPECDLYSSIRWAKEGELWSANAMDPNATEIDLATNQPIPTDGAFTAQSLANPRLERRRFILFVPKMPRGPDGKIPIVIFHHGLGGSRRDSALLANSAAKMGFATLAIDAPFHGLRSYCQTNADCAPNVACTNHRCEGGQYKIRQIPGIGTDPLGTPEISGRQFISGTNVFASRDHFRQQVIDFGQLMRVMKDGIAGIDVDDPATMTVMEKLDTDRPRYIGQSLGSIIGSLIAAAVPEIPASTLNVPGASMVDVILESQAFRSNKQALDRYLSARGIVPGTQTYEQFLDLSRWALDPADPQCFGRHFIKEPLQDELTGAVGPRKRIFISWIKDDTVVPNSTTRRLIDSVETGGFPSNFLQKMYEGGSHAFLLDVSSGISARLALQAQREALQWVEQ